MRVSLLAGVMAILSQQQAVQAFFAPHPPSNPRKVASRRTTHCCMGKWDNLIDEDDEQQQQLSLLVSSFLDMKYVPRNVMRQNQHFLAI